ncbi:AMP-binding protein, partial [Dissulfurirhabdus thermomarina]
MSRPEPGPGAPGFTIPGMLERSVARWGNRPALTARRPEGDRTLTYRDLADRVRALAKGLAALGVRKGDRCAILGPNSPEWAQAYLAAASAGAVCVPVDSLLGENEIRHILADAEAEAAFVAPRFLDVVLETHPDFPVPEKVILLAEEKLPGREEIATIRDLMEAGRAHVAAPPPPDPDDLLAIIYTSGTTGQPKGVMLTHRNVVADAAACSQAIHCEGERFLSVLPLHHTFECTAGFLLPLYTGSSITYARSLKSRDILEDLQASRATVMLGVPLLFQKMLEGIYRGIGRRPAPVRGAFRGLK